MKNKNFFCTVLGATFASCLLFSCSSSDEVADNNKGLNTVEKFLLSKNEQLVNFDINYDVAKGYKVTFKVYSENPYTVNSDGTIKKSDITPVMSGMTDDNGQYQYSRMLPGGVKEVFITSDAVGVPMLLHGVIANGSVKPEEYNMNVTATASRAGKFNYQTLGGWSQLGKPEYIDNSVSYTFDNSEFKSISKALPEWNKVADEYALTQDIQINNKSEVWLSIISDKSIFNNAIGYYCYNKLTGKRDAKEIIAFPSTRTYSLLDGLRKGEYIKLQYKDPVTGAMSNIFPEGTCIGFILRTSAFNSITGDLNAGIKQFYTNSALNEDAKVNTHASILKTYKGNVVVGFEDVRNEGLFGGDNDCNDVLMHVKTMPADAIGNDITIASENKSNIVIEDKSEAVRPLTNIMETAATDPVLKNMVIYTKSKFRIENGKVVGVRDEIYVGSANNINHILFDSYGNIISYLPSNVFVYNDLFTSREKIRIVHTTVKEMGIVEIESSRSGSSSNFGVPSEIIAKLIYKHKEGLKNGSYIKLDMYVEFEPVPYLEFVSTIPLPPYTPFIVND